ncbi:hypothetical protein E4T39_08147 [Aureobasidium subglaciale]|nr:hypothetical protein E4T39_08147 [Aureobasidium subglaciale]
MATPVVYEKPWRLDRKAVLVHAPHFDDIACLAHVTVNFKQTSLQGYIAIKINLKPAGFNDECRTFQLNILPGAVDECSVIPSSYNNLLPTELSRKLRGVNKASAAVTIILQLNKPSVVLVPSDVTMGYVSPADPSDGDFYAVSQISRATSIRLHYSKQDFPLSDQLRFQAFASALSKHSLGAPQINYSHFNGGTGAQERDWTIFDREPRLPTYEQIVLPDTVLGKRSRGEDLASGSILHTSFIPPPGSPTEIGTSFPPPPGSPTEVSASFEAGSSTKNKHYYAADALSENTPKTASPLHQSNTSTNGSVCARSTSITPSPPISIPSQDSGDVPYPTIIPTVFYSKLSRSVESSPHQETRKEEQVQVVIGDPPASLADNPILDNAATQMYIREIVCKIVQDAVDEEKRSILDEHQDMCDEAELRIAEAIEDARLAIIEKTEESCDVINEHSEKLEEAHIESYEVVQTEVACLHDASSGMEKALNRLLSVLDAGSPLLRAPSSERMNASARFQPAAHASARAAQIIQNDCKGLDLSTKVALLTTVADEGFANVFVTVDPELRKELITAWTRDRTKKGDT